MNKTNEMNPTMTGLDDIKDRVSHFVDDSKEKAADLKEKAVDLKDRALELKDQAIERGNSLLDATTDAIVANPLKAVGIAFGVGYVMMRLFRR